MYTYETAREEGTIEALRREVKQLLAQQHDESLLHNQLHQQTLTLQEQLRSQVLCVCVCLHACMCVPVCLSVSLSVCHSVCLSVCKATYPSVSLFLCRSFSFAHARTRSFACTYISLSVYECVCVFM